MGAIKWLEGSEVLRHGSCKHPVSLNCAGLPEDDHFLPETEARLLKLHDRTFQGCLRLNPERQHEDKASQVGWLFMCNAYHPT